MKRVFMVLSAVLVMAVLAAGQQQQPPQPAPGAQEPAAAPAQQGKPQPQAKTQEEYDSFLQAGTTPGLAEAEAAAEAFASEHPESELRALLFQNLMHRYQEANDAEKTVAMGRRVLEFESDNPTAAVTVAAVLAERTRETDLDREERLEEAIRLAKEAINNVRASLVIPPGTPPERVEQVQQTVLSMAHGAVATVLMQKEEHAAAEEHLRAAVGFERAQPDPVLYLRFSIALDHLKRYDEALRAAERSLQLAGDGPVAPLARQQRDRLAKLASGEPLQQQQQAPPTAPQPKPIPPPR